MGCRDKKSAGFLLPAVYSTLISYSCSLGNHRSILAGGLDTGFANISSSALWSVYNVNTGISGSIQSPKQLLEPHFWFDCIFVQSVSMHDLHRR